MAAHARRAPSDADRWSVCADALNATAHLPDVPNVFGAEGTVLHEISHMCLDLGLEPHDFEGQTLSYEGFRFTINEDHVRWVEWALSVVRDLPGRRYLEHRVSLEEWLPGDFGTLDVGLITDDLITIADFKFGLVRVFVDRNKQLLLYALGFWYYVARHLTKATRFRILIIQPRVSGGGGEFFIELDKLLAFGEEMRAAGLRTLDPTAGRTAGRTAGPHCYGCLLNPERGGPGCDTLTEFNLSVVSQKFSDLDEGIDLCAPPTLPPPSQFTPERKAFVIRHAKMFGKWLAAVTEQETQAALAAGAAPPGLKLIEGDKGDRTWSDEEAVGYELEEVLEDPFTRKLKSPAQAEKELKPTRKKPGHPEAWDRLQAFIQRDDGKPVLVPAEDARPVFRTVHQKFEDEPETS